jgi:hypothetical protein
MTRDTMDTRGSKIVLLVVLVVVVLVIVPVVDFVFCKGDPPIDVIFDDKENIIYYSMQKNIIEYKGRIYIARTAVFGIR